jgi:hypothetical protein
MADQAGGATKIIGIKITERVLVAVVGWSLSDGGDHFSFLVV